MSKYLISKSTYEEYDTFFELNKDMINKKEELMGMIDDIITKYKKG